MDLYLASAEVRKALEDLIATDFPELVGIDDQILVVFKEKASKKGPDHVVCGATAKANPLLSVVDEKDWTFVITLAQDEWQNMSDKERKALLYHHLCSCGVIEDPKNGSVKTYIRPPDVEYFRKEVEKYGYWRTSGATPGPSDITDLFGPDKSATP